MKYIRPFTLAVFCILQYVTLNSQVPVLFTNDSIKIANVLKNSKRDVEYIGDKKNGIQRKYIKLSDGSWLAAIIEYRIAGVWQWAVKPDEKNCFIDCINPNWDVIGDSVMISVPSESGRIWKEFFVAEERISWVKVYHRNGRLNHELNIAEGYYTMYDEQGTLRIQRIGSFRDGGSITKGEEKHFDENGVLIDSFVVFEGKRVSE